MLREAGLTDAERVLEGFTPSCFACAPMGPDEERRYGCDVVTVGTIDRHEGYRRRLRALNTLIREGLAVRWWGRHMSWLGNPLRDSLSPARRAWGGAKVWGPSFTQACLGGRIFLAIPRFPERAGGLSNRAFWATGVGAFYLCLYKAGMEEFFELGREVAVFRNEDEMVELVHHYLTHEDKRARIARAGQRRTLSCYTNQQVLRRIFALAVERGGPQVRLPHAT